MRRKYKNSEFKAAYKTWMRVVALALVVIFSFNQLAWAKSYTKYTEPPKYGSLYRQPPVRDQLLSLGLSFASALAGSAFTSGGLSLGKAATNFGTGIFYGQISQAATNFGVRTLHMSPGGAQIFGYATMGMLSEMSTISQNPNWYKWGNGPNFWNNHNMFRGVIMGGMKGAMQGGGTLLAYNALKNTCFFEKNPFIGGQVASLFGGAAGYSAFGLATGALGMQSYSYQRIADPNKTLLDQQMSKGGWSVQDWVNDPKAGSSITTNQAGEFFLQLPNTNYVFGGGWSAPFVAAMTDPTFKYSFISQAIGLGIEYATPKKYAQYSRLLGESISSFATNLMFKDGRENKPTALKEKFSLTSPQKAGLGISIAVGAYLLAKHNPRLRSVLVGDVAGSAMLAGVNALFRKQAVLDNMLVGMAAGATMFAGKQIMMDGLDIPGVGLIGKATHALGTSMLANLLRGDRPFKRYEIDFGPALFAFERNPQGGIKTKVFLIPMSAGMLAYNIIRGNSFDWKSTLKTGALTFRGGVSDRYAGFTVCNITTLDGSLYGENSEYKALTLRHEIIHALQFNELGALAAPLEKIGHSWLYSRGVVSSILTVSDLFKQWENRITEKEPILWTIRGFDEGQRSSGIAAIAIPAMMFFSMNSSSWQEGWRSPVIQGILSGLSSYALSHLGGKYDRFSGKNKWGLTRMEMAGVEFAGTALLAQVAGRSLKDTFGGFAVNLVTFGRTSPLFTQGAGGWSEAQYIGKIAQMSGIANFKYIADRSLGRLNLDLMARGKEPLDWKSFVKAGYAENILPSLQYGLVNYVSSSLHYGAVENLSSTLGNLITGGPQKPPKQFVPPQPKQPKELPEPPNLTPGKDYEIKPPSSIDFNNQPLVIPPLQQQTTPAARSYSGNSHTSLSNFMSEEVPEAPTYDDGKLTEWSAGRTGKVFNPATLKQPIAEPKMMLPEPPDLKPKWIKTPLENLPAFMRMQVPFSPHITKNLLLRIAQEKGIRLIMLPNSAFEDFASNMPKYKPPYGRGFAFGEERTIVMRIGPKDLDTLAHEIAHIAHNDYELGEVRALPNALNGTDQEVLRTLLATQQQYSNNNRYEVIMPWKSKQENVELKPSPNYLAYEGLLNKAKSESPYLYKLLQDAADHVWSGEYSPNASGISSLPNVVDETFAWIYGLLVQPHPELPAGRTMEKIFYRAIDNLKTSPNTMEFLGAHYRALGLPFPETALNLSSATNTVGKIESKTRLNK